MAERGLKPFYLGLPSGLDPGVCRPSHKMPPALRGGETSPPFLHDSSERKCAMLTREQIEELKRELFDQEEDCINLKVQISCSHTLLEAILQGKCTSLNIHLHEGEI